MLKNIKELAEIVQGVVLGDESLTLLGVASLENAKTGDVIFVESAKFLAKALESAASAIVLSKKISLSESTGKTFIIVDYPKLAFSKIIREFFPITKPLAITHSSAIISETSQLALGASVGAYSVIGENTRIGKNSSIGIHCVIGRDVEIGENSIIHSNVTVYDKVKIGNNVIIHSNTVIGSDGFGYVFHQGEYHKFPQIGDVIIENNVEIGSNVSIDRGALGSTIIGQGTKIDNLVQIAHNVKIGKNCVLAAQVGVSGSSIIEDNVVVGGQVGIADHVKLETGSIIGAQAGIPTGKIIRKGLMVWGTPARPIDDFKTIYAHTQNLPALKERVIKIEKQLSQLDKLDKLDN
ncbi:MAG: UDP-3-O-(3-hydroxymyristoyl)glucosamine N-acyltransferase [Acidobacteria bacterium]|nr:UDP-3-O-(3-hydroxymyristoyl)glucosamine N-acyltransferase [Acidobacteriota bacterium]